MGAQSSQQPAEYRAAIELAVRLCAYGQPQRALRVLDLAEWISPNVEETWQVRIATLVKSGLWNDALDLMLEKGGNLDGALMARICWALGEKELGDQYYRSPKRLPPPKPSALHR